MSLGLIAASSDRIYLASESEGLESGIFDSKVRCLQVNPTFAIVVAGGLIHWSYVFDEYNRQHNLESSCNLVVRLLNVCMTSSNQAFGRLCGYENNEPVCYFIDRHVGEHEARSIRIPLTSPFAVGLPAHAEAAVSFAIDLIKEGVRPDDALRRAIDSRMPAEGLQMPIQRFVIDRPEASRSQQEI